MKIAIFGATGLLGSNLVYSYMKEGLEVRGFSKSISKNATDNNTIIDFYNLDVELKKIFDIWKPDIVINTIALINLQKCEDNYQLAYETNVVITKTLCSIAKYYNSYFIHISTDHFYNDTKIKHNENDEVILLNNYAKTKHQAEQEVLSIYDSSLIVRTNIIGFRKNNIDSFFEWLLHSIQNNVQIQLFTNYFTSPISVKELSPILLMCYEKRLSGIYNISSREVIDKFHFGIKTAKRFGYPIKNIASTTLENTQDKIQRALTLGLDISKIEDKLQIQMPSIDETLNTLYKEYHEQ